jgi:ADP-ribosyl-[dinitrogen reductase] hydrolase
MAQEITTGMIERAQGCLLGQIAGDSLGALVEFNSADYIKWKFPDGVRELRDGGVWTILAGQPTDDSELALMLARSLVARKAFDIEAVFNGYVRWYQSGPFDIGNTTRQALGARRPNPESQSNGSLMRISPLGIFGARQPEQAAAWAREDSRLTHPHPACQEACAAYVFAVATAIGREAAAVDCYQAALAEAKRSGGDASVIETLERARYEPPEVYDQDNQGWVLIALQNAFYQLLHAETLEEGVVDTVQQGGDSDTNGAIAGALLGAVHGRSAIPVQWTQAILNCRPSWPTIPGRHHHPRPEEFWPADALELAESLLRSS